MTEQASMFNQLSTQVSILKKQVEAKDKEISTLKKLIELLQKEKFYDV
jgi:hypothetical protein